MNLPVLIFILGPLGGRAVYTTTHVGVQGPRPRTVKLSNVQEGPSSPGSVCVHQHIVLVETFVVGVFLTAGGVGVGARAEGRHVVILERQSRGRLTCTFFFFIECLTVSPFGVALCGRLVVVLLPAIVIYVERVVV